MPMVAVNAGSSNFAAGHIKAENDTVGIVLLLIIVLIGIVLLI